MAGLLNKYVDETVDPAICDEFYPCQVVVDTLRQTIPLFHAGQPVELPSSFENCCGRKSTPADRRRAAKKAKPL